eukprot:NODE_1807_length_1798_cov_54.225672_g1533_i0.p1 GENE.NODE_1807_length_1798_cov_54.225672_g1533_i0~~NODE_1807_length_1798_cov_54.225672_g1533_i0.p1  ORF type:complete len:343 (+),score=51.31 NODE_1807_length_1798_cov_54.225672_g1533_i0:482-1510(+)
MINMHRRVTNTNLSEAHSALQLSDHHDLEEEDKVESTKEAIITLFETDAPFRSQLYSMVNMQEIKQAMQTRLRSHLCNIDVVVSVIIYVSVAVLILVLVVVQVISLAQDSRTIVLKTFIGHRTSIDFPNVVIWYPCVSTTVQLKLIRCQQGPIDCAQYVQPFTSSQTYPSLLVRVSEPAHNNLGHNWLDLYIQVPIITSCANSQLYMQLTENAKQPEYQETGELSIINLGFSMRTKVGIYRREMTFLNGTQSNTFPPQYSPVSIDPFQPDIVNTTITFTRFDVDQFKEEVSVGWLALFGLVGGSVALMMLVKNVAQWCLTRFVAYRTRKRLTRGRKAVSVDS